MLVDECIQLHFPHSTLAPEFCVTQPPGYEGEGGPPGYEGEGGPPGSEGEGGPPGYEGEGGEGKEEKV